MVEKPKKRITIQDLYPNLSPDEQAEVEFFLDRYLNWCRQIFERMIQDGTLEAELENRGLKKDWEKGSRNK